MPESQEQIETPQEESLLERLKRQSAETDNVKEAAPKPEVPVINEEPIKVEEGMTAAAEPQEKLYHVFYHTLPNCNMTIPTGGRVSFVNGKYVTDQPHEIEHLQAEIARGNKRLSVVKGKEVMTATDLDPMAALRKKHFEEFKAMQAEAARKIAAGEPLSQSESEAQVLTPGSTTDIAALAAGSGK